MQKFVKKPLSLLVSAALLTMSGQVLAAGFQVSEQSAAGIGRANAGNGAIADDASVISSNPALMTKLEKASLSTTLTYVAPDVDIKGSKSGALGPGDASETNVVPDAIIPTVFYTMPINDKLSMGIGAFTNFGLKSQYSDSYNGSEFADTASVTTININPSIAYKLNDELSIGFGVNYLIASAEFATSLPESLGGSDLLSLEGDGNDIGWNAGIAWQASDATTVGFSYRTGFSVTLEGDASIPSSGINGADGELVLNLPSITDLSIAHNINEQLQVSASLTYTDWSTFETLEGDIAGVGIVPIKDEYYEGAYRVAVGGAYEYTPGVTLRAGLAYDESPVQAEYRSLSIPDSDRIWYSTGANFVINQQLDVDVAYTYVDGKEVAVVEESAVGSVFTGTSEGNANIVSMQLNVTF